MPNLLIDSVETNRLLMRIRAGDRQAFNDLFDRYRSRLRDAIELRLDDRLRARVDASDIVQDAQLEAYRRLDDYLQRRPMPFGLWLRKTAQQRLYNHRRDHIQATKRSVLREQPLPDRSSMLIAAPLLRQGQSPANRLVNDEYSRLVGESVAQLDELDREVLLMRNVEELSHAEIAQVLDVSHDSIRKRYGRALIKLRQLLAERGVSESEL